MKLKLYTTSGLCARLLAIISGYRLAKLSGREFEVVWNSTGNEVPCKFTDLFEEPDFLIGPGEIEKRRDVSLDIYAENDITIWRTTVFGNNWVFPKDEELSEYCSILKPKKHILEKVDEFFQGGIQPILGVHLRRKQVHVIDNCNVPFISYINKKLAENPGRKFFLASDCKDTLDIFKQIYWGEILQYNDNTFRRSSIKDMEVALINVLILSRCIFILRSGYSGFSYLASLINKTPNLIL